MVLMVSLYILMLIFYLIGWKSIRIVSSFKYFIIILLVFMMVIKLLVVRGWIVW